MRAFVLACFFFCIAGPVLVQCIGEQIKQQIAAQGV